jgi:hypothetical protein
MRLALIRPRTRPASTITLQQQSDMAARPFHLGWFLLGSSGQAWGEPGTGHIGTIWMVSELFLDMARSLERACFDYILLEDSSYVGESYNGSTDLIPEAWDRGATPGSFKDCAKRRRTTYRLGHDPIASPTCCRGWALHTVSQALNAATA